ncbi:lon protease like protein [Colletotrichum sp. SAR11_59]|nr:lon protease like protein [Colletotrichum sp. SAR11_59]
MSGLSKEDLMKGLEEIFPDCPSSAFDVKHHVCVPRKLTQKQRNDIVLRYSTNQIRSKTDAQREKEYMSGLSKY